MKYSIQINSSPYNSQTSQIAYDFIQAAINLGHEILRVFFYQDGVYQALDSITPPTDEINFREQWSSLAQQHKIELIVCVSAAQRRGLLHIDEAKRQGKLENNLAACFKVSGLGQLVEANLNADRIMIFG